LQGAGCRVAGPRPGARKGNTACAAAIHDETGRARAGTIGVPELNGVTAVGWCIDGVINSRAAGIRRVRIAAAGVARMFRFDHTFHTTETAGVFLNGERADTAT
jgi:hypothetical protein